MDKQLVSFAAIDPYVQDNIIRNVQKEIRGQEFIQYGDKNIYPQYLRDLYENVSVLKSTINGISNCFENISLRNGVGFAPGGALNSNGDFIEDIVRQIIIDYCIYGGFALNILRNAYGNVCAIYNIDFRNIRSNKKNTTFYYSEDWANKSIGRVKAVTYPAFDPDDGTQGSSILYVKNDKYATYPSPCWEGATESAECLKHISEFHLNSLYNGLSNDFIVNMNSGLPDDEIKEEVEEFFTEKYCGFQNGGRPMISWNNSKDNAATVVAMPNTGFIDRYNALEKTSKENIYTSFNISPVILGLPSENTGFKDNDVKESFEVAKKLVFEPMLKIIKRTFEKIFNQPDVIIIEVVDIKWSAVTQETETEDIID